MCSPNSQSVLSLWVWCALVDSTQCYPTNTANETALISAETSENIASLSEKSLVTLTLLAALTLLLEVATFVLSRTERKVHESKGENARKIAILEGNLQRPEVRVATMSMQNITKSKAVSKLEVECGGRKTSHDTIPDQAKADAERAEEREKQLKQLKGRVTSAEKEVEKERAMLVDKLSLLSGRVK
ncbi:MAG: hypothetical protein MMC33_002862 [Icmadophila ericetorum]|nr:hypothetical protein [Icmadophila ericetorum]